MLKQPEPPFDTGGIGVSWRNVLICVLFILVGFNLRSVILAVPPILPLIQHDLGLNYTEAGLLTVLPVFVLACMAWPAGLLAERIGERACVTIGLALIGSGALLRAIWPTAALLLLFTLLMSLGVALGQTAVPVLARRWFPAQIGLVTALFTDGLIFGESVAAGLTVPIMQHFWGADGWRATFILWGLPVVALLLLWFLIAPPVTREARPPRRAKQVTVKHTMPVGQPPRVNALHLGIMLGAGSLIYFGMNNWVASYNQAVHHAELTPAVLTMLNVSQFPASLGVTFFAQRLVGRRWPFIVAGIVCAVTIVCWVFSPAPLELLWAAFLGGSSALVFTLGIALPPLLARPGEVARLTGITISLTYAVAFVGPLVGGQLWDLFHLPAVAFLPVALASILLIVLGALLPAQTAFGLAVPAEQVESAEHVSR